MTEDSERKSAGRSGSAKTGTRPSPGGAPTDRAVDEQVGSLVTELASTLATSALQLAARTSGVPLRMARSFLTGEARKPVGSDQLELMQQTGRYLHDVRELAGLTIKDLSDALDLKDASLLEAAEAGTATLPFELILRLASLVARHDPVPFVIRMLRTYNPEAWQVLENWGIGRLPLQLERERQFINIYRARDEARDLDEAGFQRVLEFTRSAFDMALHFAGESGAGRGDGPHRPQARHSNPAGRSAPDASEEDRGGSGAADDAGPAAGDAPPGRR